MIIKRLLVLCLCLFVVLNSALPQINPVYATVPYLTISPDSRGSSMGDIGVATSPDVNSQNWNAAKYVQMKEKSGISTSFTPWLRTLVNDINLLYLSGFYRFDNKQAISASLKYFSLGEFVSTEEGTGNVIGSFYPNEFSVDAGYSRMLSKSLSGALVLKFIRSDISGGAGTQDYRPGYSYAADFGVYYQHPLNLKKNNGEIAWGVYFSNFGSKISYRSGSEKEFIPANMRLGVRYTLDLDDYNSFSASAEINKLLVPTRPITDNSTGEVIDGKPVPSSLPQSWIQSFYDAPGGFSEEMKEFTYAFGLEYWYMKQFAIRGGYFHESEMKGNKKFFALGVGLRLNVFSIDCSYLISTTGKSNPLANTMRFTLGFLFNK